MSRRGNTVALAWLLLGVVTPAQAHLMSTGLGPVYDGAAHFLASPVNFLPLVALLVWVGLQSTDVARRGLMVLLAAWWVGALIGQYAPAIADNQIELAMAVLTLVFGLLIAFDTSWDRKGLLYVSGTVTLALGALTGMSVAGQATVGLWLLGNVISLGILASLMLGLLRHLVTKASWLRVAVRVLGSWLAACSLLWMGWMWRTLQ